MKIELNSYKSNKPIIQLIKKKELKIKLIKLKIKLTKLR